LSDAGRETHAAISTARAKLVSRQSFMKNVIFTILKFGLFLFIFFVGSFFPPFHFEHILIATPGFTRIFIADGLLLMLGLYIVIVLIEVLRNRLHASVPWTTLALILATVLGLMMKFGFLTRSAF
jgi:hypothetical protein